MELSKLCRFLETCKERYVDKVVVVINDVECEIDGVVQVLGGKVKIEVGKIPDVCFIPTIDMDTIKERATRLGLLETRRIRKSSDAITAANLLDQERRGLWCYDPLDSMRLDILMEQWHVPFSD